MITVKQYNLLAQFNHIMFGALAVFAPATFFDRKTVLYMAGAFFIYAATKEFWYDEKYETPEIRGSSLEDFLFYILGLGVALGLYLTLA